MKTAVKKLYEAMFLVDSAQASDWDAVVKNVKTILKRADAEIVSIRNWAERKLAYEINSKSRGTYVLCYFKADGQSIRKIEKDVQLSEQIMRVLILSAETREKQALEDSIPSPDSRPRQVGDEPLPAKEEAKTAEVENKEDVPTAPEEKEEKKAGRQVLQDVSTPQETGQAGEPVKPAEPEADDAGEPQQTEDEKDF